MASPSNILVFGATGNIGIHLVDWLLKATPAFNKIAIFTSPNTESTKANLLSKWKAAGVSIITGDVTNPVDVTAAYKDIDTIVSAVGRNVLSHQIELLELAEASGSVKWFFPSEYGTDIEHNPQSATERPHQVKLAVRKFVREETKRLRITYLVTGPFFEMWAPGNFDVAKTTANIIEDGEGKIGFCTMSDVGKFLVAALTHPTESRVQILRVQSFVVTPNQVLAVYEKQTGDQWAINRTSLPELRELEKKLWEQNHPQATPTTLRRIWAEGGTLYQKNDNEIIVLGEKDLDSLDGAVKRFLGQ